MVNFLWGLTTGITMVGGFSLYWFNKAWKELDKNDEILKDLENKYRSYEKVANNKIYQAVKSKNYIN